MTHNNKKMDAKMATSLVSETVYKFANGVPGFPSLTDFYIRDLRDGSFPPLKIMVSVDNPSISFILYPHIKEGSLFDEETLYSFARTYDRPQNDVDVYSVVTVHQPGGDIHLTTNLKAPIILDRADHKGWQHIIPSHSADMAFPLDCLSERFQGKSS